MAEQSPAVRTRSGPIRTSAGRQPARALLRRASRLSASGARALSIYDHTAETGARRGWSEAADVLSDVPPTRISVDVFDTLLTRRVVGDPSLWWIVGATLVREGRWHAGVDAFVRARRAAAEARPNGTLADIYAEAVLADQCSPADGAAAEHAVERSVTVALDGAREGLERLRAAGHRLVFVSDMHLSRGHIRDCLGDHGLTAPADELVISSEVGAAKWDGTLFPLLTRGTDSPIRWHIGNDLWSDVAMAERARVRALPVRRGEASGLERAMVGPPGSVGAAVAAAAASSRQATTAGPVQDALREVGADVGGQCLTAFLLWIRETCDELGVRHVLFLARDGELPLQMARAMPADHWDGFTLTYLQGSRRMWSVAAAASLGVEAWLAAGTADASAFLRQGEHSLPWASLLARLALRPDDLTAAAPRLASLPAAEPLPSGLAAEWLRALQDHAVRRTIASRAERQHTDLLEHLHTRGIGAGRVAVVDVGWRGQLAWHVSAVLRGLTGAEPVHLHFGGVDVATSEAAQVDIRRFAVDDSREALPFPDVVSCVETITASGKQRARSLERGTDGSVRLVFDPALPDMDTEHRHELWRAAVAAAAALPSRATLRAWDLRSGDLDRQVRQVLADFWLRPSHVHALAAAHLAAEVDDAGAGVHPVALPYALRSRGAGARRTWRQGSLRLTTPALRAPLTAVLRLRDRRSSS